MVRHDGPVGPPPPVPPATPSRSPTGTLVAVGLLVLLAGAVLFLMGMEARRDALPAAVDEAQDLRNRLEGHTAVPGTAEVELGERRYHVLVLGRPLVKTKAEGRPRAGQPSRTERRPFTEPEVTVTGPDGQVIALQPPPDEGGLYDAPEIDGVVVAAFDAPERGTYVLAAEGGSAEVTDVGIGRTFLPIGRVETPTNWMWSGGLGLGTIGAGLFAIGVLVGPSTRGARGRRTDAPAGRLRG